MWLVLGSMWAVGYVLSLVVPQAFEDRYIVVSAAVVGTLMLILVDALWSRWMRR